MATNEALVLDGLALNDGTVYSFESVDLTPPPEIEEWIKGADSYGAVLAREPLQDNRIIEAQIRINPQATMDLALAKIAAILDKLQECKRNPNGLALTWVPADATLSTVTFRCLSGQITGLPIDMASGWFVKAPLITVKMTCLPFAQGAEVLSASVTSSDPIITLELTGVAGDAPALGRLVVTDAATKDRRYMLWGLESRYYPTSSPPSLIVDSASMVTGFAGATATRTAAYSSATNNVISATLRTQLQTICELGNLSHVGSFRPQLRCHVSAATVAVRLSFKSLDNPYRSLSFKVPSVPNFNHIDLGLVNIPAAVLGTQRWTGRIEAYSTASGGETFQVDAVWLMPAERFGRARAKYSYESGVLTGFDQFTSITTGTALNARVATIGGTWATSGAATDFTAADLPLSTDETQARASVSDTGNGRLAVLGSTNYTNVEVGVDVYFTGGIGSTGIQGVIARYVDANNFLYVYWSNATALTVVKRVASVETTLTTVTGISTQEFWRSIRLVLFASGIGRVVVSRTATGEEIATSTFVDSVVATGGTLATGKPGFFDKNASATAATRYFDNFYAATPPTEPVVCYSGQSIEFRHNATLREDSTGTYAGDPPEYVGARFVVPPAGGPARKARIAVIARRWDVETAQDDDLTSNASTDSTTLQAYVTPQYVVVPR